jgi:hypothetical protein
VSPVIARTGRRHANTPMRFSGPAPRQMARRLQRRGLCSAHATAPAVSNGKEIAPCSRGGRLVRLFSWWRVGAHEPRPGLLRAATAHGGRLMSPAAKFSWLTAAMAVALFGLIVLSLDRITPRDENGAMLAIPQRSS